MRPISLTKSEEKLMLFLWEKGKPLSVSEIIAQWADNTWTKNYTRDIVRGLEEKGVVEFCGLAHNGKNYARRFRTTLSKEEYYTQLAKHRGVTVSRMLQVEAVAMAEKGDRDGMEKLIHELEEIIEEYRSREDEHGFTFTFFHL